MHQGGRHLDRDGVDLGDEPPLMVYDERAQLPDRRQVSIRWLTGSVLTGLTSVTLMGGALFAALDGQYQVSAAPVRGDDGFQSSGTSGRDSAKGDRVIRAAAQYSNRQVIPVSTVHRVGDRDHIKVRPFALVTATLATRASRETAADIPPFNPIKLFSDNNVLPERAVSDAVYDARVEGEVSISVRDFPVDNPLAITKTGLQDVEIEQIVRQSARFLSGNSIDSVAGPVIDPGRFDFNLAQQPELSRLNVRITPENVSFVSKSDTTDAFAGMEEKIIPVSGDRTFREVLLENAAGEEAADAIISAFEREFSIKGIDSGQRIRLAMAASADAAERMVPQRISLYTDTDHQATVARSDTGDFVAAEAPDTFLPDAFAEADRVGYAGTTPTLYDSLYQTALEQNVEKDLISDLVRIFSFDVDFKSRVKPGDSFEVFYGLQQDDADVSAEILYTALTNRSTTRRFYRFRTPDDGVVDFYDETGKSAKKFLMRKPLSGGRYRSGFGMRKHPIVGTMRMHNGVDWSAQRGTAIMAAGGGVISRAKWVSGYGRRIEIQHANGYTTTYSHQTSFAKGIREGMRVRQGQVIGYVGSTGLSTGPHLHYEVKVNGRFVNPMRIRLPRGRVLEGDVLEAFNRERDRIDTLVQRAAGPSRVASLAKP
ncbi:M23 family metallopeptidase [Stappia sp. ES.058]|uniref:M23 family metallopeptidase n=1 Tax=Stappia sp. ES.058 TaxID=1881061 RepID=UPI00087CC83E|nr:M23 family metallopeptidase [Stappia sp. ES.058]SDU37527.1 Murein DD-endopeptidase MepM and murein hydrolase activator NlpD, contain LysM domain [Stappia sp. ES.058]